MNKTPNLATKEHDEELLREFARKYCPRVNNGELKMFISSRKDKPTTDLNVDSQKQDKDGGGK